MSTHFDSFDSSYWWYSVAYADQKPEGCFALFLARSDAETFYEALENKNGIEIRVEYAP